MTDLHERKILTAWQSNAQPWSQAVRENRIESRVTVTNKAIVDTVLDECRAASLTTVLDLGCGEGWLVRELNNNDLSATGMDAVDGLIDRARELDSDGKDRYKVLSYNELADGELAETFDVVVANFSLLGEESVGRLFAAFENILNSSGRLIVQTVHPVFACGEEPYENGWREESWKNFGGEFTEPAPWFFRTLESWTSLFVDNAFELIKIKEPLNLKTKTPASIIFVAKKQRRNT